MRGFFSLCHCFFSFWHYGVAGQYMTTTIGGGFLSLNKFYRRLNGQPDFREWSKFMDSNCSQGII
jgi:hypothetical protein